MDILRLKETMNGLAIANHHRSYGNVVRRDGNSVFKVALDLEVKGKRNRK